MIKLSAGTAAALGLTRLKSDARPTTAYLLHGSGCLMNCAFCPQARGGEGREGRLGRVSWPSYSLEQVKTGLSAATGAGMSRICLQGVRQPGGLSPMSELLKAVRATSPLPVSVSAMVRSTAEAAALFQAGAERVSVALDVVNPQLYTRLKGGSFSKRRSLLANCARRWPGRISTHIICGMGETEEEVASTLDELLREGITVGLFAFTPLPGTRMADHPPPDPASYRRMQAARHLLSGRHIDLNSLEFDNGRLVSFGIKNHELIGLLSNGEAFQTGGCPGCNRPYYNEKPGGTIYNYPRPLRGPEVESALALILGNREDEQRCRSSSGA